MNQRIQKIIAVLETSQGAVTFMDEEGKLRGETQFTWDHLREIIKEILDSKPNCMSLVYELMLSLSFGDFPPSPIQLQCHYALIMLFNLSSIGIPAKDIPWSTNAVKKVLTEFVNSDIEDPEQLPSYQMAMNLIDADKARLRFDPRFKSTFDGFENR